MHMKARDAYRHPRVTRDTTKHMQNELAFSEAAQLNIKLLYVFVYFFKNMALLDGFGHVLKFTREQLNQ